MLAIMALLLPSSNWLEEYDERYWKAYNERNTTESSAYVDEYVRNFLTGECIPGIEMNILTTNKYYLR